jgi:hypothetical protein
MRHWLAIAAFAAAAPALADGPRPALPENYGEWTNFYSNDRWQVEGQFIRCYANETAVESARGGGDIAYGSTLVAELWTVLKDGEDVAYSLLDARVVDAHAATVVMERIEGADAQYDDGLDVGDWAFSVYNADGSPRGDGDVTACRECHEPLSERQYLFTYEHLAKRIVE